MKLTQRRGYRTFACMLSMLVGIGLVRYSFAPLIPSMLSHTWIDAGQAGFLGTINFIGNLLGALCCTLLARRFNVATVCRWTLLVGLFSVTASAWELGFWWLAAMRFIAGMTAAGAMILAPVIVAAGEPPQRRGRLIGLVFAGSGIGVIGLSLLLPLVLGDGPSGGWLLTAALCAVSTALAWPGLRVPSKEAQAKTTTNTFKPQRFGLWILTAAYFLAAVGVVPHSIYLSAYVHQVLKMPVSFSTMVYAVYGLGVLVGGPLLDGLVTKRLGTRGALVLSTALGLGAVVMVLATTSLWWVVASGAVLGMAQMGIASIASHRVIELAGPAGHTRWWGLLTIAFNIGMASGSFAMGTMLHLHLGYLPGFWMAGGTLAASTVLAILVRKQPVTARQ
ncbi:MAG: YbfB/YjiJ family MFS transporter [Halioglobus sp.]|nr:YbfB/YjiJ family MFS transporter [Halioglobus sp.]